MHTTLMPTLTSPIVYPDSDGKPMADNTKQLRWIVMLYSNLAAMFRDVADVFVAANLMWYVIEGDPEASNAADVLVVFGRPKGVRGSYKQWEENDAPVTVAFDVLSPGNDHFEMADKLDFNDRHGVEEYYVYYPDNAVMHVYLRQGEVLRRVRDVRDFVSPRLNIRFDLSGPEMVVYRPDGLRFLSPAEQEAARTHAEAWIALATQRAEEATLRAARLAELSRKARRQQTTTEELAELERLEEQLARPLSEKMDETKA